MVLLLQLVSHDHLGQGIDVGSKVSIRRLRCRQGTFGSSRHTALDVSQPSPALQEWRFASYPFTLVERIGSGKNQDSLALVGLIPMTKLVVSTTLDSGPASVDGWLSGLVADELGIEDRGILDTDARELLVKGERLRLTQLEFGVMNHPCQPEGKAVSRASFLGNG